MKKLFLFLFMGVFFATAIAQDVDDILAKYYESIGGVEVWKDLNSMKMTGTSSMQGMEFPIAVYSKRPNLEKVEIEVQGMQIVQAFDGTVAWHINPFQGDTEATKGDVDMTNEAAKKRFEPDLIDYKAKGHMVELLGDDEIEGAEVYKLKLTKKDGDEVIYFFEKENHVPIMERAFANAGPMKGQAVETYLSDYEEVEGLVLPTTFDSKVNGKTILQFTMKEIELNAEITEEVFMFPGEEEEMKEPAKEMTKVVEEKMEEKVVQKEEVKEDIKKELKEKGEKSVKEEKLKKKNKKEKTKN